jgi:hypothetical protein
MNHKPVSTSSAKDDMNETLDLNELALAMYADSLGLTDKEYEELKAMSRKRKPKLEAIATGLTAIAFIALSIAAIVVTITNWGWK